MSHKPRTTKLERDRCVGIVSSRKNALLRIMITKPLSVHSKNCLRRTIALLNDLEQEMWGIDPAKPNEQLVAAGDFSAEEMERAQAIIEEQQNPFLVDYDK